MSALSIIFLTVAFVAKLSWYDPELCHAHPINCFDPQHWYRMAAGHDAREWYGKALACPEEFPIGTKFTIAGSRWGLADGDYVCLDRGGAVTIQSDGSIVLDLLRRDPIWGDRLIVMVALPEIHHKPIISSSESYRR